MIINMNITLIITTYMQGNKLKLPHYLLVSFLIRILSADRVRVSVLFWPRNVSPNQGFSVAIIGYNRVVSLIH